MLEALPAVEALVDAVIGAGENRARLARMHRQAVDAALAPQPAADPLPAVAAIGAGPGAAADGADADREIAGHVPLSQPVWEMSMTTPSGPAHFISKLRWRARRHFHVETVFFGQLLAGRLFELVRGGVEVFDLKAEMVDAAEIGAVRADVGVLLGLEVEDREIDVAVGQKHRTARVAANFAHAERLLVKGGGLCRILGRQSDMLDSGHVFPPCSARTANSSARTALPRPLATA